MKEKIMYVCSSCGYQSPKWMGKCPSCNEWSSFAEETVAQKPKSKTAVSISSEPVSLDNIQISGEERYPTNKEELDRVLGGGIVKGSLILVGGDPGIGKSTLLLQICDSVSDCSSVMYVSGEESLSQIKLRAQRLNITTKNLTLLSETSLDSVIYHAKEQKPQIVIIDSIQTMFKEDAASAPGSVSQVRECTYSLMRLAKENAISVIIVGHVTKDGNIAGPRVLEHMVDCVLYFEGERHQSYRILRTVKNRFGSTNEIGVFEMKDTGLSEVKNPSEMLLSSRPKNTSGTAIVCTIEGTRPVLSEVQALCSYTGFGTPRRVTTGVDFSRSCMLIAVLEKKLGFKMQSQDVYINIVGGIKIAETATDLAVALSIASNYKNFSIDENTCIMGEVGLTGEVRSVSYIEKRIMECKKLGFKKCIVPKSNSEDIKIKGIEIIGVSTVKEAIDKVMN
ncbi:MAG: DNA repair protein RadA [Ruminococcaceae bacterium]|nr:DNA repair protein RadA [Oscillospiraceae bacterium]